MTSTIVTPSASNSGIFAGSGGSAWEGRVRGVREGGSGGSGRGGRVRRVTSVEAEGYLEDEHVLAAGNRPHQHGIQGLIVLF